MIRSLNRRRFMAIAAAGAIAPRGAPAATTAWRGRALGAEASIRLGGIGHARAADTFAAITAELARLEEVFSLYRDTSALSRLNRQGHLDAPPADLVAVLRLCDDLHAASAGAFDPTIQPLWRQMAAPDCGNPQQRAVARKLIGWDGVGIDTGRITFARPGMEMTLNGVAQGYITDRVADLLRQHGYVNVLVDIGEISALGRNDGAPWQAQVALPGGRAVNRLTLADRCLAVSSPGGTTLCAAGHILDPRGDAAKRRLAAVSARTAAVADGLSTACCLLSDHNAKAAVAKFPGAHLETII